MNSVMLPGRGVAPRRPRTGRRQRPSTLRSRGFARASMRTMMRSSSADSSSTSSGLMLPQKNYVAIETIHSL